MKTVNGIKRVFFAITVKDVYMVEKVMIVGRGKMHPKIYERFENVLKAYNIVGKVLEVGAIPSEKSLLASKTLKGCKKIGINLVGASEFKDFKILKCNANDMSMFENENFDCVMCNAVLEHDKYFWKSIKEMKRVLKINGLLIIGTPSYTNFWFHKITNYMLGDNRVSAFFRSVTFCFKLHDGLGDYYRFSEQAFKEVFFEGFKNVRIKTMLLPTRTIGHGVKK